MPEPIDYAKLKQEAEVQEAQAKAATAKALQKKTEAEAELKETEVRSAQATEAAAKAFAQQRAKAEADKATAAATTETAKATKEEADAIAAKAVAQQKAKAEADKATAGAMNDAATAAKNAADARTAAAGAATAEAKAGLPDVPEFAKIAAPVDKSVNVVEKGGAGTAEYAAARALEGAAEDIGLELASVLGAEGAPKPRRDYVPHPSSLGLSDADGKPKGPQTVVWIMDSMTPSEASILLLEIKARLRSFKAQLDKANPEKEPLDAKVSGETRRSVSPGSPSPLAIGSWAISTATGLIDFGVQLVGALRSKYALYNRQVNLNRQALLTATAGALVAADFEVRWPRFSTVNSSALIADFTAVYTSRDELAARLPEKAPDEEPLKAADTAARKLIEQFDTYATAIMTAPEGGGQSPFLEAALFEVSLPPADEGRDDVLLYVDISGQGADAITGYGVAKGSSAAFLGFVQVYFTATTREGALRWAGTSTVYTSCKMNLQTAELTTTTPLPWLEQQQRKAEGG